MDVEEETRGFWRFADGARGLGSELLTLAACLGIGVIVMPCLIFAVGRLALGAYAHGNVFAMWRDFMAGLISGSQAAWFIALGPYLFVWLLRGARRLLHN